MSPEVLLHKKVSKVSSKVSVTGNLYSCSDTLVEVLASLVSEYSDLRMTFWHETSAVADGDFLLVRGYLSLRGVGDLSVHLTLPCFNVFLFSLILKHTFLMHCESLVCFAYSGMYFPLM